MPNNPGNSTGQGDQRDQRNQQGAGSQGNMDRKNQNPQSLQGSQPSSQQGNQQNQKSQMSGGASSQNLRLQLTPEQQQQIRKATGKDASSLELSVEDIEDSLGESAGSSGFESSSRGETKDEEMGSESEF